MKTTKKVLSLMLVLVLVFALAAPAMADGAEKTYPYTHYFSIGDSIARGCGMPLTLIDNWAGGERDDYFDDERCFSCDYLVEGAFPQVIRDTLGVELNNNLSVMGLRTVETYWALGGDIDPYAFDDYCVKDFGSGASRYHMGDLEKYIPEFINEAGTADLITLQLGSNDIFYSAQARSGFYGLGDLDLNDLGTTAAKIGDFVKYSWEGYENFKTFYPKIIERILELQMAEKGSTDNVKIALVGCYGPFANAPIVDGVLIPVGEILTVLPDLMNSFMKEMAAKYEQCVYVDIRNVETPVTVNEKSLMDCLSGDNGYVDNGTISTHPTADGHAYIAAQILDAIAVLEEETPAPRTYINFKLPHACKVDKVLFGVVPALFEQSADGKEITVKNFDILQTNMTVIGHNESTGKQVIYTYALHYKIGEGYSVYRIAGSTDVGGALSRAVTGIGSLLGSIGNLLAPKG